MAPLIRPGEALPSDGGLSAQAGPSGLSREHLEARLEEIAHEGIEVDGLRAVLDDEERSVDEVRDSLSTRLMEIFRLHQSRAAFGLLFELNRHHLYVHVAARLRRYSSKADANDVLQEVFVNVYRYPHRFNAAREDAFRVWTATIVRNTVLKHLRSLSRSGRAEVPFEDLPEPPDRPGEGPLRGAIANESQAECNRVYLTYLHLYLCFYRMLSEREQRAIHLVEVEGLSYRAAAGQLGIKLENLKMVVFRARRKIHRSMRRVFEGLPPDVRPARQPRAAQAEGDSAPHSPAAPAAPAARGAESADSNGRPKAGER